MSDSSCIATIRCLAADMVQKANSGHPGAPMGMAPIAHALWGKSTSSSGDVKFDFSPEFPLWPNRDRFVLSNGHACSLQYSMLHLCGYKDFGMEQLQNFRQVGSNTPGHPENHVVEGRGVEVTTGPLGQGIANAVGLAISAHHMEARFNKPGFDLFGNFTFCFVGDGCLQEGISQEAASLAGHLGLGRLIVLYDDNQITIDGDTDLSFSEDIPKRFEACGWHTLSVANGDADNVDEIVQAIKAAQAVTDKPTIISVKTTIGFGSSKEGTSKVHGAPLGAEDLAAVKAKFGMDADQTFVVPDEVRAVYRASATEGDAKAQAWNDLLAAYTEKFPAEGAELKRRLAGELPDNWRDLLPKFTPEDPAKATRQHGQTCINAVAEALPEMVGGSADLNPSCLTYLNCSTDYQRGAYEGRNIRFGVREHAMAAVCNGIAAYGCGNIPFCSTFFNFIQYMLPSVRLSAMSEFGVVYILTHDSIGLGEDGPTHQPINALMLTRAMPNILCIRPADGNETSAAFAAAIANRKRPTVIALTRQGLPNLAGSSAELAAKGAYALVGGHTESAGAPDVVLVGTGSETPLCVDAAKKLAADGKNVRVVSMPCWELFAEQPQEYQESVFPAGSPVLAVEAGAAQGWREYAHASVAMTTFGASGPAKDVFAKFGFTVDNVAEKATKLMEFYSGDNKAHSVVARPF